MMPSEIQGNMTLTLIRCNLCKGIGISGRAGKPGKCPQCEGSGCLMEIQFIPPVVIEQYGWILRGALARVETKGENPYSPRRLFPS